MEWRIFPLDVLFFRGLEPMNAGEATVIHSRFPPSPEVMQGFVRTALLAALGVAVQDYAAAVQGRGGGFPEVPEAIKLLGGLDDLGQLDLRGPYLIRQAGGVVQRWYPAPLDLRGREGSVWHPTNPGDPLDCDLGAVSFLPKLEEGDRETKVGMWISQEGLAAYLRGDLVPDSQIAKASAFFCEERRVGIGRNPASRATEEGMLYAPVFVRLKDDHAGRVGIGLRVNGIDALLQERCAGLHRLGGEGRLAAVEVHQEPSTPVTPGGARARLVLLTPARWGGRWLPQEFRQAGDGWHGDLEGQAVTIVSAAVDKPARIGGWDIAAGRPKPAEACVPAGSVYFLHAQDGADLGAWHDRKLGTRGRAGFGHVVVGYWSEGGTR
ncbi:MAG: type III-B CRISPR module-associated protein Cmr3 [Chloroflexi bacterium]|nr:type III-B CRISPR module-associated protein Cmr3 [Chloroflexota bacterium]